MTVDHAVGAAGQRPGSQTLSPPFVALVALDDSEASLRALVWAMRTAQDNQWTLDVLTVWPMHAAVVVHGVPGHFCEPRWSAAAMQSRAIASALEQVDDAPAYTKRLENGPVLEVLLREAALATVIVLGTDEPDSANSVREQRTEVRRLTTDVRQLADCSVVLVPGEREVPMTDHPHPTRKETAMTRNLTTRELPYRDEDEPSQPPGDDLPESSTPASERAQGHASEDRLEAGLTNTPH